MARCAFTICTKSYIGLAKCLEYSIKKYSGDIDFIIYLADKNEDNIDLPENAAVVEELSLIDNKTWINMSFKYDVTEFCTSLKPFCFTYLFDKYDQVIYLDPDILFFSSIEDIFLRLDKYEIVITPHITVCNKNMIEKEIPLKFSGIYNLGFIGIKKSHESLKMLEWWQERLKSQCFSNMQIHQFTDQKWIDFLPAYFDAETLLIEKDLGWNVAYWNFHERKFVSINNRWHICNRLEYLADETHELLFVHFSGFDYRKMIERNDIKHKYAVLDSYKDIEPILYEYAAALRENKSTFDAYFYQKYTYNYYDNGTKIDAFQRRLYNGLVLNNINTGNPFIHSNEQFFGRLKTHKMIKSTDPVTIAAEQISNVKGKEKVIHFAMKLFYKIIGYKNYIMFLRFMRKYTQYENQIHLITPPPHYRRRTREQRQHRIVYRSRLYAQACGAA
jgi:hypothetical protein